MAEQDKHNLADVSKHTPGPWEIEPNPREIDIAPASQNTLQIVAFAGTENKEFIAELSYEANARLIAAAPDLLKACEAWEKAVKHGELGTKDLGSSILAGEAVELTKAALELAKKGA